MAKFEVKVVRVDEVTDHPNADRLTLVKIGGYTCISNKHDDGTWRYAVGDLVVYVPSNALVPEWMLRKMGMWKEEKGVGILSGKKGNRVKPIRLRGIFSEGIIYPLGQYGENGKWFGVYESDNVEFDVTLAEGDDVADLFGITKYEPVIPTSMGGEVFNLGFSPVSFDVEPIEKHMDVIPTGASVTFTEKLHGTFCGFSVIHGLDHPDAFTDPHGNRDVVVYSKGLGTNGLVFKNNEHNASNIYVMAWKKLSESPGFVDWFDQIVAVENQSTIQILGEVYGAGVQDLTYGADQKDYRIFAIGFTLHGETNWSTMDNVEHQAAMIGARSVPMLYAGPFSHEVLIEHRDGVTSLGAEHIREGVVITSNVGLADPWLGDIRLKSVSPDYKLRNGGTEYN